VEVGMNSSSSNAEADHWPQGRGAVPRWFWWSPGFAYVLSVTATIVFFIADVILPRGATVAIGYCVVPAVAAGTRRLGFLFGMTLTCTVLTWTAFFLEPAGYPAWKSVFDRAMVTGVVWLALVLVLRRAMIIRELVRQKQTLNNTLRELERSNGELTNFASVVAHDLRGPLNTVGLLAHLLSNSNSIKADAECIESMGSIRTELDRMGSFIQSLLAYGRVGSGDIRFQVCDCASVLSDVQRNLMADLKRNSAEILNDGLPVIQADPVLIAQLFQNLIENSIKYRSDESPRIHISAVQRSEGCQFTLRDNGIGIRPEDFEKVFKPFSQIHGGRAARGGVGLGLATCKRIVERHGGCIEVLSKPGEGASFVFTIPQVLIAIGHAALPAVPEPAANEMKHVAPAS
jgi:signal transduction histidine kinase